jgi:1-acyl-sn-glycerol-3-phosphate acyltransferase
MLSQTLTLLMRVLVGAQPRWIGSRPSSALRIYYANHTSHMDTLALWCALPGDLRAKTRPVAASDYWGGKGLKSYIATRGFNALFIERNADKRDRDPLAPGRSAAARESPIIFLKVRAARNLCRAYLVADYSTLLKRQFLGR